jgi:hypothetical protein
MICAHKKTRYDGPGYTKCWKCGARFAYVALDKPPTAYKRDHSHAR